MLAPSDKYIEEKIEKGDYKLGKSELKLAENIINNIYSGLEEDFHNFDDNEGLSKMVRIIVLGLIEKAVKETGSVDFMDEMLLRLEKDIKYLVDLIVSTDHSMMLCRMCDGKPFTYYDIKKEAE